MEEPTTLSDAVPTVEQMNERTAVLTRLVDSLLRGRSSPSARHEAAAAMSDVRSFVRKWRKTRREMGAPTKEKGLQGTGSPSADLLLKLAQRGVHLHNTVRKLPQSKEGGSCGGSASTGVGDWKSATIAYLRATAASLVSLGSTSSPKDCANLCRLFSKAGDMLVEAAEDDIRALEMFDDAQAFFSRLPSSFFGREAQDSEILSLSAEDLVMAMHKASTRRIEVLSRTTGNVDEMVIGYEHQLNILSKFAPPGMSVSTATHAASVGEERFKKGDCRGASRLFRVSLRALGTDLGEGATAISTGHTTGLRGTILFSLAHCYSQSGDHVQAIQCIKTLEDNRRHSAAGDPDTTTFLFAKCKVLCDAGDFPGAHEAAEALVEASPPPMAETSGAVGLELAAVRMVSHRDECSDRSLGLFSMIAARWAGSPKEFDAQIALLHGLGVAVRVRSEGCSAAGTGNTRAGDALEITGGLQKGAETVVKIAAKAEETAEKLINGDKKPGARKMTGAQIGAALEVVITFAEFFQARKEWKACAKWCNRAIRLAEGLMSSPPSAAAESEESAAAEPSMLAGLLTLRGEMECRLGEFGASTQSLDRALEVCPSYNRAREVAFWSASCDPACDESSLSSRLSTLLGPRSGLDPRARCEYLAFCVALVAEASTARDRTNNSGDWSTTTNDFVEDTSSVHPMVWDGRVMMVQERLLETLLISQQNTTSTSTAHLQTLKDSVRGKDVESTEDAPEQSRCDPGEHDSRALMTSANAKDAVAMEVDEACDGGVCDAAGLDGPAARKSGMTLGAGNEGKPCGVVQVVASMVNMVLKSKLSVRREPGEGASVPTPTTAIDDVSGVQDKRHIIFTGSTATSTPSEYSVLSRVLQSIDKAMSHASSLDINLPDDPDIDFLGKGCWNLAVNCCGPKCGLPCAVKITQHRVMGSDGNEGDNVRHTTARNRQDLLTLAPGFFKDAATRIQTDVVVLEKFRDQLKKSHLLEPTPTASRHWMEMKSDANKASALVARQNCTVLGMAAALETYDRNYPIKSQDASIDDIRLGVQSEGGFSSAQGAVVREAARRATLERCRQELEVASGLNRQLSEVERDTGIEMRPVILAAEINVLSRLGDAAAVRSLVAGREHDFVQCSTDLLCHCMQVVEDILDDNPSLAALCRLCIRRCAEDDPIDTTILGGLYRRLLMCSSSRNEALLVADEFSATARDLREGPGMPSDDVDYMAAKCYNLGLQMLEMERPTAAERFVGRALGLLKLGASKSFEGRWADTMHKVYCSALHAKEGKTSTSAGGIPGPSVERTTGRSIGRVSMGGAFRPTGIFPLPPGKDVDN